MTDFTIDKELDALLPPLSETEYLTLKNDIAKNGILSPLITSDGVLIDGHNRYRISKELNIPYQTVEMKFNNRDEIMMYMVMLQIGRRNLIAIARLETVCKIRPALQRMGASNKSSAGASNLANYNASVIQLYNTSVFESRAPGERDKDSLQHDKGDDQPDSVNSGLTIRGNLPVSFEKINTQKLVARLANVSTATVARYDIIVANTPEKIADIYAGKATIYNAYNRIVTAAKKEERLAKMQKLAEKTKGLDLGVKINTGLYSKSELYAKVVINNFDQGLENIAREVLKNTKYYIILAPLKDTYKVPTVVADMMNHAGITVLETDDGVVLAHVFGPKVKFDSLYGGDVADALAELIACLIEPGDICINPYPTNGTIAKAIKQANGIAHVFTGGNKEIETIVRAELAPKSLEE
jgi:hypothetical protein